MTRQEFIDDIYTWEELIYFCDEYNLDFCRDIFTEEGRDEEINRNLVSMANYADDWTELLEELRSIPDGYEYYYKDEDGEWFGVSDGDDNYFLETRRNVLEYIDENGMWDDEEDEEDAPYDAYEEDDFIVEDEPISVNELIDACNSQLQKIVAETDNIEIIDSKTTTQGTYHSEYLGKFDYDIR